MTVLAKETGKILWAEAGPDFGDLLCSLLLLPVGSSARLLSELGHAPSKSTICNLLRSVTSLDPAYIATAEDTFHASLPRLQKTHPVGHTTQLCSKATNTKTVDQACTHQQGKGHQDIDISWLKGYVKEGSKLLVTDSLEVLPVTTAAMARLLGDQNIAALKEVEVTVTQEQVLQLIQASFESTTVLNDVFGATVKNHIRNLMPTGGESALLFNASEPQQLPEVREVIGDWCGR